VLFSNYSDFVSALLFMLLLKSKWHFQYRLSSFRLVTG